MTAPRTDGLGARRGPRFGQGNLARTCFLALALFVTGCAGIRLDFVRRSGEQLSLGPDQGRPGKRTGYQGSTAIDEESFYRIAGDEDAAKKYKRFHEGGRIERRVGGAVAILGAVQGTGGGIAALMFNSFGSTGDTGEIVAVVVFVTGLCQLFAGLAVQEHGRSRAMERTWTLIDDPERMQRAADKYNQGLPDRPENGARPRQTEPVPVAPTPSP